MLGGSKEKIIFAQADYRYDIMNNRTSAI